MERRVAGGVIEENVPVRPAELAQRLFVPVERYGWEYRQPVGVAPSPLLQKKPQWREPLQPDWTWHDANRRRGRRVLGLCVAGTVIGAGAVAFTPWGVWLAPVIAVAGLAAGVVAVVLPERKRKKNLAAYTKHRDALLEAHKRATATWSAEVARHDRSERERVASAPRWYPLRLREGWSRVDVFGGTPDGWASLLATLGPSILESRNDVLVVDFSENGVADDLAQFARLRDVPVSQVRLPAGSSRADVLSGLSAEDAGELIANATHPGGDRDDEELRALDADLLEAVAERLEKPYSFARLEAGVRVLRRVYDVSRETVLSAQEVRELTSDVDTAGSTEKARERLQFLNGQLKRLVRSHEDGGDADGGRAVRDSGRDGGSGLDSDGRVWNSGGLTVVATHSAYERRKGLYDRIVFHRVLRDLRAQHRASSRAVIVVAGADHLGLESLEALSHQAKRVGVRLVLLMEHLRDELQHLLGGSDSVSIVMRLGNHTEATAAADFIGKGHTFVLSQVTEQVGKTFTEGTGRSDGVSDSSTRSTSMTRGRSDSSSGLGAERTSSSDGRSWSRSRSDSRARSTTWQETVNHSAADSTTMGRTEQRVYEHMVEPTTIQALPPTACFLVQSGEGDRRVVVGDCNPGITLLEHVADRPVVTSEVSSGHGGSGVS